MIGKNVEIKARLTDCDRARSVAAQIADSGPVLIDQQDTFFNCPDGRLKFRKFSEGAGELIHYHRPDTPEPAACDYSIVKISKPDLLTQLLANALGVVGVVRKKRTLYMLGQTRIHFDDVDGLGRFIELEVVLSPEQTISQAKAVAESIMEQLGICEHDLIETAYIDMLLG